MNNNHNTHSTYKAPFMEYIDFNHNKQPYEMFRNTYRFIAFTDILPSQYGSFGLDDEQNPFPQMRQQTYSQAVKDYLTPQFSKEDFTMIDKLYMFPLKPERLNIVYDKANTAMYNE